ncbi:MAG: hypothetical protein LRY68_04655, partial [Sulfurospirillum sp.]|nr:hypothetical protein [Sulfurospirillum sp.]
GVITFQRLSSFLACLSRGGKSRECKIQKTMKISALIYIASDWEFKAKDALWPNGYIAVFVLHGGSEAYRVNVCVMNPAEGYKQMMSAKVWSENGAHEVCKFIQRLFYFEGEIEAAT